MMSFRKVLKVLIICAVFDFVFAHNLFAQDTVQVNLNALVKEFETNNLNLKAVLKDIQSSKGFAKQTELWDNPNLSFESNIYNPSNRKFFDVTNNGQFAVQIQQLITLFGKRNKKVDLANLQTQKFEEYFKQLEMELKFQLSNLYYSCYFDQQSIKVYNDQIANLHKTVEAMEQEYAKGVVPLKELARIKSFVLTLESERNELTNQILESQREINIITANDKFRYLEMAADTDKLEDKIKKMNDKSKLVEYAYQKRMDLVQAKLDMQISQKNIELQKALAYPDISIGMIYDKNSNFIPDYTGLNLSIDLPIFNTNSGNIEASNAQFEKSEVQVKQLEIQIKEEVQNSYSKFQNSNKIFTVFNQTFLDQYNSLNENMIKNYNTRNIGILEFLDFYDSFKTANVQFNNLRKNRVQAALELLFVSGQI